MSYRNQNKIHYVGANVLVPTENFPKKRFDATGFRLSYQHSTKYWEDEPGSDVMERFFSRGLDLQIDQYFPEPHVYENTLSAGYKLTYGHTLGSVFGSIGFQTHLKVKRDESLFSGGVYIELGLGLVADHLPASIKYYAGTGTHGFDQMLVLAFGIKAPVASDATGCNAF